MPVQDYRGNFQFLKTLVNDSASESINGKEDVGTSENSGESSTIFLRFKSEPKMENDNDNDKLAKL